MRPIAGRSRVVRGLTFGLLSQEAHFDAAFMAVTGPSDGGPPGRCPLLEAMGEELARQERDGHAGEPAYAELQHRFDVLGGYTLDQRVDEALSGLGFARDEWGRPPTAMSGGQQTRAALARLVIADPELLCSMSRRTISTSARSSGSRVTSGDGPGRSS